MGLKYLNDLLVEVEAKEVHDIDGGCTSLGSSGIDFLLDPGVCSLARQRGVHCNLYTPPGGAC